jgi:hypothetical protein
MMYGVSYIVHIMSLPAWRLDLNQYVRLSNLDLGVNLMF